MSAGFPGDLLIQEFGVGSCPDEIELIALNLIDQQKITTDMAFAMIGPIPFQRMVEPFRAQRCVVRNQEHHGFFQLAHIVPPAA